MIVGPDGQIMSVRILQSLISQAQRAPMTGDIVYDDGTLGIDNEEISDTAIYDAARAAPDEIPQAMAKGMGKMVQGADWAAGGVGMIPCHFTGDDEGCIGIATMTFKGSSSNSKRKNVCQHCFELLTRQSQGAQYFHHDDASMLPA